MMAERLTRQIRQMREVHQLEQFKKNKAAQDRASAQYVAMLQQAHLLMQALFELKARLSFSLSRETSDALRAAMDRLKAVSYNGMPTQDQLEDVKRALKPVEGGIKAEWKNHHRSLTENPLRILQIAQTIEPERCRGVIQDLRAGANWTTAPDGFKPLFDALDESKEIIRRMDASDGVIAFLERMNRGAATVADLNPEVLDWLRNQSLTDQVYLKFDSKGH